MDGASCPSQSVAVVPEHGNKHAAVPRHPPTPSRSYRGPGALQVTRRSGPGALQVTRGAYLTYRGAIFAISCEQELLLLL